MAHLPIFQMFQTFCTLLRAIYCFFLVYISLIMFSFPVFIMVVYRTVLSIIFKTFYGGRYEVMGSSDAPFTLDKYANLYTITFFIQVNRLCDIEKLKERLASNLLRKDGKGRRPYGLLLKAAVQKFGFTCWEDQSTSIDFNYHVRLCPGAGDENKIYTENEVFDAVAKSVNNVWDEDKPRWEVLVTPKVKLSGNNNEDGEVGSLIAVKILHVYVDGVSFVQVLRNCIFDQPPPKFIFDPVNPPITPISFYEKILTYIQFFFMGPYYSLRMLSNSTDHVFYEGPLTGQKMIGRTKMEIPLEMMRRIRRKYNCSTQSLLHSAFTSALQNMAKRKGLKVPNEVIGGIIYATLPYPDEYPRNIAMLVYEPIPMGFKDPAVRVAAMERTVKTLNARQYALLSWLMMLKIIGLFPPSVIKSRMSCLHGTYLMSNVPGGASIAKIHGKDIENVFGVPPIINGMRYCAGVGCYNGKFTASFMVEKSRVVGSRTEMDEFINEFENEIKYFDS